MYILIHKLLIQLNCFNSDSFVYHSVIMYNLTHKLLIQFWFMLVYFSYNVNLINKLLIQSQSVSILIRLGVFQFICKLLIQLNYDLLLIHLSIFQL